MFTFSAHRELLVVLMAVPLCGGAHHIANLLNLALLSCHSATHQVQLIFEKNGIDNQATTAITAATTTTTLNIATALARVRTFLSQTKKVYVRLFFEGVSRGSACGFSF